MALNVRNDILSNIVSLSSVYLCLPWIAISSHRYINQYQYFLCINDRQNYFFEAFDSKTSMRCYSEKTGPKYQICDKSYGFQTCFTKYDASKFSYSKLSRFSSNLWILLENQVVLRGCSSKRKMFHIECESHLSGTRNSLDMGEK